MFSMYVASSICVGILAYLTRQGLCARRLLLCRWEHPRHDVNELNNSLCGACQLQSAQESTGQRSEQLILDRLAGTTAEHDGAISQGAETSTELLKHPQITESRAGLLDDAAFPAEAPQSSSELFAKAGPVEPLAFLRGTTFPWSSPPESSALWSMLTHSSRGRCLFRRAV